MTPAKTVVKMRRPGKTACTWCHYPSTHRGLIDGKTVTHGCEFHIKIWEHNDV